MTGEEVLIAALVPFPVPVVPTPVRMTEAFEQAARRLAGMPRLISKHCLVDGKDRGGASRLLFSRDHAEALFNEDLR